MVLTRYSQRGNIYYRSGSHSKRCNVISGANESRYVFFRSQDTVVWHVPDIGFQERALATPVVTEARLGPTSVMYKRVHQVRIDH